MINIKTWKQLLNERIGDMQITTNNDVRLAMQDHIDALTEALKVAQAQIDWLLKDDNLNGDLRIKAEEELAALKAAKPTLGLTVGDKPYTQNLIDRLLMPPQAMTERDLRALHQSSAELIYSFSKQINTLNKATQPLTKEQVAQPEPRNQCGEACERAKLCAVCLAEMTKQPAQGTAGAKMPCGAVVTNVYDAYEAGKKAALLQSNAERVPLSDKQREWIYATCFTPKEIIDNVEGFLGITKGQQ